MRKDEKAVRDLFKIQKDFFADVAKSYFAPIKLAVAFLAVFSEMFRQMFVSLAMNSDEFETLQELKIFEETAELSLKGLSEEEIEAEFD